MSDDKIIVPVELYVGGNLPQSKRPLFVSRASSLYDHSPNEFSYKKEYKERIKANIYKKIQRAVENNEPLHMSLLLVNGEPDQDFLIFCSFNQLKVYYRVAPFIDHHDSFRNEVVHILDNQITSIPTDGEMNPTTLVEGVFDELNNVFDALESDPDTDPTRINDDGILGDVARRRMAGEPLRKMLTEILRSRIAYPEIAVPNFKIV